MAAVCSLSTAAVLYDITQSGTYKERDVPPSPKVRSVGSGDAGAADAPLLQRLQDFLGVAGLVDPYEHQQQQVRLRRESGSGPVGYGSRERQARQAQQAQQAQQRQRGGAAAAAGAAAGPRPYFWRLQQRLQAGGYRPGGGWGAAAGGGGGSGDGPVSDEDYALLFRRQVYDNVSQWFIVLTRGHSWTLYCPPCCRWTAARGWSRRSCLLPEERQLIPRRHKQAAVLLPGWPGHPTRQLLCHTTLRHYATAQDLWAVPLSTQAPRISLGSGTPQERRLTGAALATCVSAGRQWPQWIVACGGGGSSWGAAAAPRSCSMLACQLRLADACINPCLWLQSGSTGSCGRCCRRTT